MSEKPLRGKQLRYLRGLAHSLKPTVIIGVNRVHDGLVQHVDAALEQHELLKVRLTDAEMQEVVDAGATLAETTGATIVQRIGHTLVLYRRRRKSKPTLSIPK
ncbi:MAG: YhbY family RNA-binding protein [Myxococcota bacterium]